MSLEKELEELKQKGNAPEWMTIAGYTTISRGYRLKVKHQKECTNV